MKKIYLISLSLFLIWGCGGDGGQTGTKYLVRQLEGVVYLAPVDNPGNITLGTAAMLPTDSFTDVGPNGGDNYIGALPTVDGSVSVIHGVKQ